MQPTLEVLRLKLRMSDSPRLLARIVGVVAGRGFEVSRCDFRSTAEREARLRLDVRGDRHRHHNLYHRVRQLVGVISAEIVEREQTVGRDEQVGRVNVERVRVNTRMGADSVKCDATLALMIDEVRYMAVGEGTHLIEALQNAFEQGIERHLPGALHGVPVRGGTIGVLPGQDLRGEPYTFFEVEFLADSDPPHGGYAAAPDVVQAGTQVLSRLYAAVLDAS